MTTTMGRDRVIAFRRLTLIALAAAALLVAAGCGGEDSAACGDLEGPADRRAVEEATSELLAMLEPAADPGALRWAP